MAATSCVSAQLRTQFAERFAGSSSSDFSQLLTAGPSMALAITTQTDGRIVRSLHQ